jgi:radical SAM protein with 4Fe4S-binding SPASM domain
MLDITQLNALLLKADLNAKFDSSGRVPLPPAASVIKPTVTWRITRSCNLSGLTCQPGSRGRRERPELSTVEALALISDLAAFQVPRLVLAGGEPLLRDDLTELVAYAREVRLPTAILTSGALLTRERAFDLRRAGLQSVVILKEPGRAVDRVRGKRGKFAAVLEAYDNSESAGLTAEIRIPLDYSNYPELAGLLDLIEHRRVRKVVFAHLVYTSRGNRPQDDLTHEEKRRAMDLILDRAEDLHRRGVTIEISTDENHADGIYYHLKLARKDPLRAAALYRLLPEYGAALQGAGVGVAGIDSVGNVHPDPCWASYVLGNVRETPFSEIWGKSSDPLLLGLRDRLPLLKGSCANCRWKQTCGGNLRVRAAEYFHDPWTSDPACYLTNKEITKEVIDNIEAMEEDVLLTEQAA